MPAVVAKDRRELPVVQKRIRRGAAEDSGDDDLVTLIEIRERPLGIEICLIRRTIVTIEIGDRIMRLAVGVVAEDRDPPVEALPDLQRPTLIEGDARRRILVRLQDQWIDKTRK